MPKPDQTIRVAAAITEQELEQVGPQYGCANDRVWNGHAQRSIHLVTFAGALNVSTGLYEGEYRFLPAGKEERLTTDFTRLPGLAPRIPERPSVTQKTEDTPAKAGRTEGAQ